MLFEDERLVRYALLLFGIIILYIDAWHQPVPPRFWLAYDIEEALQCYYTALFVFGAVGSVTVISCICTSACESGSLRAKRW